MGSAGEPLESPRLGRCGFHLHTAIPLGYPLTVTRTHAGELGRLGLQGLKDYFAQLGLTEWSCNNAAKELTALWPTCEVEELKTRAAALERMLPGVDVAEMVKRDYVVLLADPGERHMLLLFWGCPAHAPFASVGSLRPRFLPSHNQGKNRALAVRDGGLQK